MIISAGLVDELRIRRRIGGKQLGVVCRPPSNRLLRGIRGRGPRTVREQIWFVPPPGPEVVILEHEPVQPPGHQLHRPAVQFLRVPVPSRIIGHEGGVGQNVVLDDVVFEGVAAPRQADACEVRLAEDVVVHPVARVILCFVRIKSHAKTRSHRVVEQILADDPVLSGVLDAGVR